VSGEGAILVHEARARFEDRTPEFGNAEDRQAIVTLALYHLAVVKATRRFKTPTRLERKLEELEQSDAATLEGYLHPGLARKPGGRRGR